jgi:hypothetical protein
MAFTICKPHYSTNVSMGHSLSSTIKTTPPTIHIPTWAFYVNECARQ